MTISLHPLIDHGVNKGKDDFPGGILYCHCATNKVQVTIKGNVLHNHACGCSQCWKPTGAIFAVIGVVPVSNLKVTANEHKLSIIDPSATILRHACKDCGVHMYGRIEKAHAFRGLDFVHVELSDGGGKEGWAGPGFAAFVSSLIEQGAVKPGAEIDGVRERLKEIGLVAYDSLNPPLMDAIATFAAEKAAKL